VRNGDLYDLSSLAPTVSDLFDLEDCAARVAGHQGDRLCSVDEALRRGHLLAPCDLQAIKAAGVTFIDSLIERVLEERAGGDAHTAQRLRKELLDALRGTLDRVQPGSPESAAAKAILIREGQWSQYLEVAIGPDAEIFTKAQPLAAVGCGAALGLLARSHWSASEAEIVLAVSSPARIVGATLGNDLTLRDFESRSALLLGRAKDNNASCAIGPFVRLFDDDFTLDRVRRADVDLRVEGLDGFVTGGSSSMSRISRDPSDLVAAAIGPEHQYPDGLMLFLGTMFVPHLDRRGPGSGFTHEEGDLVRVSSPDLGALINRITSSDRAPPWTFGTRALMQSLATRRLLK
jgi:fumarylacetoacetate (FAA) hydrolase family protein